MQPIEQDPAPGSVRGLCSRSIRASFVYRKTSDIMIMGKRNFRAANTTRSDRRRPTRRVRLVELTGIELLDRRVLPAVSATFSAADGILQVIGDDQDNTIAVSRNASGTILVNNGAVAIQGDQATVANTVQIAMTGLGGNDNLSLDETNGALPKASILGGAGNDILTGGSGDDSIIGGPGNDTALMGDGRDTFVWNPGDGSDTVEGQGGADSMVFNGSDAAENIAISANGNRVRFTRDVGGITMDLNGVEGIDFNALGGADTITLNDPFATDLDALNLNLNNSAGNEDGQADAVVVNGTEGDDAIQVVAPGNGARITVGGLSPIVNITGAEWTTDTLTVNALGGNDTVDASNLPANLIGLSLNGGAGNDLLLGSLGDDLVNGGTGNDVARMGDGDDTFVWNPGDGSDTVEGEAGSDTMVFNGANVAEKIDISANGNRVRFTRDVGTITMDLHGVDQITFNALGGADTITVNDLTGTDVSEINLNLAGVLGGTTGDAQPDSVIVNGSNGADLVPILGAGTGILVNGGLADPRGLQEIIVIGNVEATDALRINGNGGDDVIDAEFNTPVMFTADGGAGNDTLTGSPGNDLLIGGDGDDFIDGNKGNDVVQMGAGSDVFQWDPGDGSDTVDGQAGADTMVFNGADAAENIDISANGNRVRFTRNVGNITMDLVGVEEIDFNALGGADTITVNDLTGTDVNEIDLNLAGVPGGAAGDAQADSVIVNGTNGADLVPVLGDGTGILINGGLADPRSLREFIVLRAVEATDALRINGNGGDDVIDAEFTTPVQFTADGGAGNDTLKGSANNDLLIGGDGDDFIDGNKGNDVVQMGAGSDVFQWDPGDGSDTVDGQGGSDSMVFNGADAAENIDISANGNRVRFTRNVGNITMDLVGVEEIDFNALGGADTITVNDQTTTDLALVKLNLIDSAGNGDGQSDSVIVNGTDGDDTVSIAGLDNGNRIDVSGLVPRVSITGAEATYDHLTVNTLGGHNVVDASNLPANRIGLTVNGAATGTNTGGGGTTGGGTNDGGVNGNGTNGGGTNDGGTNGGGTAATPPKVAPVFVNATRIVVGKGRRQRVVGFTLNFSGPLGAADAQNLAHYHATHPAGKGHAAVVRVLAATTDAASSSVSLLLRGLKKNQHTQLSATGLTGANGEAVAPIKTALF